MHKNKKQMTTVSSGAQMYSKTSGYSDNFEWHSPHTDRTQR